LKTGCQRIFGHKREEVSGESRRLHNEKLYNLYTAPNFSRRIKSRRMRWTGYVAHVGNMRNAYNIFGWKTSREETVWKT
jgi:hypothetical protein